MGTIIATAGRPSPDAVLLDLDGTVLDTERLYRAAFMRAAASLDLAIPDALYARLVGLATPDRGRLLGGMFGPDFPWEALRARYYEERRALLAGAPPLRAGWAALATALDRLAARVAIVTSASRSTTERHLDAAGITGCFNLVITRDEVARGKPAPDGFELALRLLGARPARSVAVEDSPAGVRAALGARVPAILVRGIVSPDSALAARCLCRADDLGEVARFLWPDGEARQPEGAHAVELARRGRAGDPGDTDAPR